MKFARLDDHLIPINEFKARAATVLRELRTSDEPVVITQNGRAAAVVLSPATYDAWQRERAELEALAIGFADLAEGRTVSGQRVEDWLRGWGAPNESEAPLNDE